MTFALTKSEKAMYLFRSPWHATSPNASNESVPRSALLGRVPALPNALVKHCRAAETLGARRPLAWPRIGFSIPCVNR